MPYQYEKLPGRICTYINLDPESSGRWKNKWVENPRTKKKWVEPDYYLRLQEMTTMKRDAADVQKKSGKYTPCGDKFLKDFPLIECQLGDCWWDDGKPRLPCHLKLEVVGEMVHVALIDTADRRSCHTAHRQLHEALALLEAHLAAGGAPWRSWGPERGRRN